MGLLGLILYIVEKRKKEISIRKVLGAGVANIALLLNTEFIILIGIDTNGKISGYRLLPP